LFTRLALFLAGVLVTPLPRMISGFCAKKDVLLLQGSVLIRQNAKQRKDPSSHKWL